MKRKSLAVNSFFNIIYTLVNIIFPLITSMYTAHILMLDGVGKVARTQNAVSYFLEFAPLGIPVYGIREIAKVADNREQKNRLFSELIIINGVSTLIAIFIYISMCLSIDYMKQNLALYLSSGLLLFFNLINVDWLYKGEEEYAYIAFRNIFIKIIFLISMFFFVRNKSDYVIYALLSSLAGGGNYLFNVIHSKKFVKFTLDNLSFKRHLRPLFIILFGIFLSDIYGKVDVSMLGIMVSDEAVGNYTYAMKIITIAVTTCTAITSVYLPRLSVLYKTDSEKFLKLLESGERILCFITFPMAVGLYMLSGKVVLLMFGDGFAGVIPVIHILIFMILIRGFGDLFCYRLLMSIGYEKVRLPSTFLASLANVILNFWMIPIIAERGAAIASVISEVIVCGYQYLAMSRKLGIHPRSKPFVQAIISTVVMGIVVYLLNLIELPVIISLFLSFSGGVCIYCIINILMKNEFMFWLIEKSKLIVKRIKIVN